LDVNPTDTLGHIQYDVLPAIERIHPQRNADGDAFSDSSRTHLRSKKNADNSNMGVVGIKGRKTPTKAMPTHANPQMK